MVCSVVPVTNLDRGIILHANNAGCRFCSSGMVEQVIDLNKVAADE